MQAVSSARFTLRKVVPSSSEALLRENPCFLGILQMEDIATPGEGQLCRRCRTDLLPPGLFPAGSNAAVSLILGTRGARVTRFTGGPRSHSQKP